MAKATSFIKRLLPREERFHELLARDTENLVRAMKLFAEIAATTSFEERRLKTVQLKAIEHEGDTITRRIFEALNSTFLTPLEQAGGSSWCHFRGPDDNVYELISRDA